MNDLRYFRNDKLDLVNKEKQRFGFRKLSSGKIASVLLGVTIFGSFALNGQVVKADTTTNGSQTSAVVDEAKSTQNNEEQGATAAFNEEEQSGQDASAQKDGGSHSSLTITSDNLGDEETTEADQGKQDTQTQTADKTADTIGGSEAETGKTQTDSTGTNTQNPNRRGTTSDTNSVGDTETADKKEVPAKLRALVLAQLASIPVSDQPTAETIAKKYTHIDVYHAKKILDYYNNIGTITKILDLDSSKYSYGGPWLEGIIGLTTQNTETFTNSYVDRIVGNFTGNMVEDTQKEIDERIKKLQDLSSQYPNNQDIKNTIDKLTALKDNVTSENVTNAAAMADTIDQLDKYGSQQAYNDLEKAAKNPPKEVNKDDLKSAVAEADTVKAANSQASEDKQQAYQAAIEAGQTVLKNGQASQDDVNNALSKIEQAKKDLTGSALQTAVDEASDTKTQPNYYNASEEAKKAYNDALEQAKSVLANPKATQDQLDEANSALTSAKAGLTGVATDNSGLEKAVKEAPATKADSKYYNASQDKKQAYDQALDQATKLLNDKNASQKAVDEAVANLEKAKAKLNGEPNFIGGDYTPSEPSTPSTETLAEKTTEKILMHAAYLYDNKGIKIDKPTAKSYVTVVVAENPVTINGIKYYKVAGKDDYIKAGNIDGTLRVITHNSYIYNNKGKATRNKGIKRLVKKTRIVRTYGAPINIKGHMMYRIGKNRYIKARNFEGTLRRLSHNSFVYDENGKATRNKGIRRLLKKSRVVRTFNAPVKINGHMMYRVDNGYVKVKNFK